MMIKVGKYELENDVDMKCIAGGFEIFSSAVEREGITPDDFNRADWAAYGSIIVEDEGRQVRYQCVSGYMDAEEGMYTIGEEIENIGPVQYIEEIEN